MDQHSDPQRSRVLDSWNYHARFAPYHIAWGEGDITPAFDAGQAYAIAVQELRLQEIMAVAGHREVLVTFSSPHILVGAGPTEREPAWVVLVAGTRRTTGHGGQDVLHKIPAGGGAVLQLLIHARRGEILLGIAVPVALRLG